MKKHLTRRLAFLSLILLPVATLLWGADSKSRQAELAPLLKALQWKPPPPRNPDYDTSPNPGWFNPKNRDALASFIEKYPNSEEAYLAEAWLIFAGGGAGRSPDIPEWKRQRATDAQALTRIITNATSQGTAKIAKLVKSAMLLDADMHEELKILVDDILSNIREYETEQDLQFKKFLEVTETPPSEIEPYLRQKRVISECHQGNLTGALVLAEELQAKYPDWSKRELIHSAIYSLKHSRSPYPTWEELKKAGPTLQELIEQSHARRTNDVTLPR